MSLLLLLLLGGCRPAGPTVAEVEWLEPLSQTPEIQGRDGGTSASLWGRSVWTFGDTVLNVDDVDGVNWHHNSFSLTEDGDASDGLLGFWEPQDAAGAPAYLIAPTEEEHLFNLAHWGEDCAEEPCGARWAVWPGEPVWDEANQRALVPYGLIYAEPGDMNFSGKGQSIAIWTDPEGVPARPVVDPDAAHPDLIWGEQETGWGIAPTIVDDHLYLFGCDLDFLSHDCKLARAPLAEVQTHRAWRYLDRRGAWSADPADADVLFQGAPIMSIHYSAYHGGYLAMYSEPFSPSIVVRTAPALEGPWSRATAVLTVTGDAPYDVLHHTEFAEEEGRVQYLTWSRATGETWFSTEFPLVRVTFE